MKKFTKPDFLSRICNQCTLFCCDSSTLDGAWEINSELVQVCGHILKFFLLRIFTYFRLVSSKVTEVVLAVSNIFGHLWTLKMERGVWAVPCLFPRKEGLSCYIILFYAAGSFVPLLLLKTATNLIIFKLWKFSDVLSALLSNVLSMAAQLIEIVSLWLMETKGIKVNSLL